MNWDATDLAAIFDPDMPGYAAATIGGVAVPGLFGSGFGTAFGGLVSGEEPTFRCAAAAVASVTEGSTLIIGATTWTVRSDPELDGSGMATLRLAK
jgi:hypothetical protein